MEQQNEDIEYIESLLIEGIAEGHIEPSGMKKGEMAYSITPSGEERVFEMAGGKDVVEATSKLLAMLVKHGAMGFPVESNITTFTCLVQVLRIFKHYGDWQSFKNALN